MNDWRELFFNDFIKLNRGFDLPNDNIIPGQYPVVASTNIKAYHNKSKVKAPCVVTGRSGSLGIVQYIHQDCWPLNTALYVKDFKINYPKFVFYFLKTMGLENFNSGAGVPTLNQNHLHKIKIKIPQKITQKKIAAILSAYDDLIENNNHRIALLEGMAEELYKEWFVRMRFPGHEQARFVKGIPEGWAVKKLAELVKTQYGFTASASTENIGPKFLRITDIAQNNIDWESVPHCKIDDSAMEKYLLRTGDLLVARTGATVGYAKRINKLHPKSVFASYLVRLIPNKFEDNQFLGQIIESNSYKNFINMFVTGSAQPQANAKIMTQLELLYPTPQIIKLFNQVAEPLVDQKEQLMGANKILKQTRDSLLTRLISGKLSVENLDIAFPPSMLEEV